MGHMICASPYPGIFIYTLKFLSTFSNYVILRKSSIALLVGQVSTFELSKESFFKLSITEYTV